MKPASFRLFKPSTLGEALELLQEYGADARVLAGGQSLVPMMNFRLARPQYLIDLHGIPELRGIRPEQDGIWIGSMTTHAQVEQSELVRKHCPVASEVVSQIGYPAIRHRGTAGGSVAHADPAAEWPLLLQLLEGRIIVTGPGLEESRLAPEEFFLTVFTTTLQPDQIITGLYLRRLADDEGWGFHKFARRFGDFGLVNAGALVRLAPDGTCEAVRVVVGAVEGVPMEYPDITATALGKPAGEQLWRSIGQEYADMVNPEDDLQASADYRRQLVRVLVYRSLRDAAERASALNSALSRS